MSEVDECPDCARAFDEDASVARTTGAFGQFITKRHRLPSGEKPSDGALYDMHAATFKRLSR